MLRDKLKALNTSSQNVFHEGRIKYVIVHRLYNGDFPMNNFVILANCLTVEQYQTLSTISRIEL